jgi:hypothetical protein
VGQDPEKRLHLLVRICALLQLPVLVARILFLTPNSPMIRIPERYNSISQRFGAVRSKSVQILLWRASASRLNAALKH